MNDDPPAIERQLGPSMTRIVGGFADGNEVRLAQRSENGSVSEIRVPFVRGRVLSRTDAVPDGATVQELAGPGALARIARPADYVKGAVNLQGLSGLLLEKGVRLFQGMASSDAVVLVLDWTPSSSGWKPQRIVARVHRGREVLVSETWEKGGDLHAITFLARLFHSHDPDFVVAWKPAELFRCALHPHNSAALGRFGSEMRVRYQQGRAVVTCPGRHVLDLAELHEHEAERNSALARLPRTVRAFARHLGCKVRGPLDRDPDTANGRLDLFADVGFVAIEMAIALCQLGPFEPRDVWFRGPGYLASTTLVGEYLKNGRALPEAVPKTGSYPGGRKVLRMRGIVPGVFKIDIASMYPTIILNEAIDGQGDPQGAMRKVLRRLLEHRAELKAAGHRHREQAVKTLINSFYGLLGSSYRFNDPKAASTITARGRELILSIEDALVARGCEIVQVDTDGILFARASTGSDEARALVDEVQAECAPQYTIRLERGPATVLSVGTSIYALSDPATRALELKGAHFGDKNSPPVVRHVLKGIVRALLVGDVTKARDLLHRGRRALEASKVSAWALLPPALSGTVDPILRRSAAYAEHVEGCRRILQQKARLVLGDALEAEVATAIVRDPGALVRGAEILAPTRVREAAPYTMLVHGMKSGKGMKGVTWVRSDDARALQEYIDEHGPDDVHQLLLDVEAPSVPDGRAGEIAAGALRKGDFYIECETKALRSQSPDYSLLVARMTLRELAHRGADLVDDVRVIFNGGYDLLVLVRQGALGVPSLVNLHEVYRAFADNLHEAVLEHLRAASASGGSAASSVGATVDVPERVFDREIYAPTATYRARGSRHERVGGYVIEVPVGAILDPATTRESLLVRARAPIDPRPWPTDVENPQLAASFEFATRDVVRRQQAEARPRSSSPDAARHRTKRAQRHLRVLNREDFFIPCRESTLERMERGESVGFERFAKYVYESRHALGMSDQDIVEEARRRGVDFARYHGRFRIGHGGTVEIVTKDYDYHCSTLWQRHSDLCDYHSCYRSRPFPDPLNTGGGARSSSAPARRKTGGPSCAESFSWPPAGPERAEAQRHGVEVVSGALSDPPPGGKVRFLEAPPRSQKSRTAARVSVDAALEGRSTFVFGPAHEHLGTFSAYIEEFAGPRASSLLAVHVRGRDHGCHPDHRERRGCHGCPMSLGASEEEDDDGVGETNETRIRNRRERGVFGTERLVDLADRAGLCARTVGLALSRDADIVLMPAKYLLTPELRKLLGRTPDRIVVDEADQVIESYPDEFETRHPIAVTRHARAWYHAGSADCGYQCASCHFQFPTIPAPAGSDDWVRFSGQPLGRVSELQSPRGLLDVLHEALRWMGTMTARSSPSGEPCIDLAALEANVRELEGALVEPTSVLVAEKDRLGKPTGERRQAFPRELIDSELSRQGSLGKARGPVVPLAFRPCLRGIAVEGLVDSDGSAPRRWTDLFEGSPSGASPEDLRGIDALYKFAVFTHRAATHEADGDLVGLQYHQKPWPTATFVPGCSIDLVHVRRHDIDEVRDVLAQAETDLVSGTHLDFDLTARVLGLGPDQYVSAPLEVPLHRDYGVYLEGQPRKDDDGSPAYAPLELRDVPGLLASMATNHTGASAESGPLRVLCFLKSKKKCKELRETLVQKGMHTWMKVTWDDDRDASEPVLSSHRLWKNRDESEAAMVVHLDYLRSGGSRAVDRPEFDVLLVVGEGLPNFAGLEAFAAAVPAADDAAVVDGETLAMLSRKRAVVQAVLRNAGGGDRPRVGIILNGMTPDELPSFMQARVVTGDGVNSEGSRDERVVRLARSAVDFVLGGAAAPTHTDPRRALIEVLRQREHDLARRAAEAAASRVDDLRQRLLLLVHGGAKEQMLTRILEMVRRVGYVVRQGGGGKAEAWLATLEAFEKEGLLSPTTLPQKGRKGMSVYVPSAELRYAAGATSARALLRPWRFDDVAFALGGEGASLSAILERTAPLPRLEDDRWQAGLTESARRTEGRREARIAVYRSGLLVVEQVPREGTNEDG